MLFNQTTYHFMYYEPCQVCKMKPCFEFCAQEDNQRGDYQTSNQNQTTELAFAGKNYYYISNKQAVGLKYNYRKGTTM